MSGKTTPSILRWRKHVSEVERDLKRAAETPPWFKRTAHEVGEYFGFSLSGELKGLFMWLTDQNKVPRQRVIDLDVLDHALSELHIARTALTYRIGEPEHRESALERLRQIDYIILDALR